MYAVKASDMYIYSLQGFGILLFGFLFWCWSCCFPSAKWEGFPITQVFNKTFRGEGHNVFGIKQIPNSPYCPVTNLLFSGLSLLLR